MNATAELTKVAHYGKVWIYIRYMVFADWKIIEAKEVQVVTKGDKETLFYKTPGGRKWHGVSSTDITCWVVDKKMALPPTKIEKTTDRDREIGVRVYTAKHPLYTLEPWETELMQTIESHGAKLLHRLKPNDNLGLIKPV